MATGEGTQNTPNPQGSGDDSGKEKLYAGKFKTVEELEKAHKELERGYHQSNERFSRLEEKFDTLTERLDEGYGRGQQTHQPQNDRSDDDTELKRLYSNPRQWREEIKREVRDEILKQEDAAAKNTQRVNKWLERNQDLVAYPEVLTFYVNQGDKRKSIEDQLETAAKFARKRIIEIRGKEADASDPDPEDIIEGPTGERPQQGQRSQQQQSQPNAESQLAGYAMNRNRSRSKPLNVPRQK